MLKNETSRKCTFRQHWIRHQRIPELWFLGSLRHVLLHDFPHRSLPPSRNFSNWWLRYHMVLQHVLLGPLDLARIERIKGSTKGHARGLKGLQEVNISFAYIVLVRSHLVLSTAKTLTIVAWLYVKENEMVWWIQIMVSVTLEFEKMSETDFLNSTLPVALSFENTQNASQRAGQSNEATFTIIPVRSCTSFPLSEPI